MRLVKVIDRSRGTILGERVEIADNFLTRLWGLLGRSQIDAGGGLWIKPSSGVHTLGMKFAIDVVGLSRDMRVVKVWKNLSPYRATSVSMAISSVIELSAGKVAECGVELGDFVEASDFQCSR